MVAGLATRVIKPEFRLASRRQTLKILRMRNWNVAGARRAAGVRLIALSLLFTWFGSALTLAADSRGGQFIWFTSFGNFEQTPGARAGEVVLTSPIIAGRIAWDELVASWDTEAAEGTYLTVEARAVYPELTTGYYILSRWSKSNDKFPRECVLNQKDEYGDVSTDTLILRRPCRRFQLRLTLGGELRQRPRLKFLGVTINDSKAELAPLVSERKVWGKVLEVPERSQMKYPNGGVLCSPTTVSMIMSYWAGVLGRPDLDRDVPEVAAAVYDRNWKGTGNWPFNTAYAGGYRGIRGYVTRLSDLTELEDWIGAGVPVGLSIDSARLRGRTGASSGHLVVCVGFTEKGEVVLNDPGTSQNVRKVFPRKTVEYAWAYSKNAVYLIHPEKWEVPADRFGHWASWSVRQRIDVVPSGPY